MRAATDLTEKEESDLRKLERRRRRRYQSIQLHDERLAASNARRAARRWERRQGGPIVEDSSSEYEWADEASLTDPEGYISDPDVESEPSASDSERMDTSVSETSDSEADI